MATFKALCAVLSVLVDGGIRGIDASPLVVENTVAETEKTKSIHPDAHYDVAREAEDDKPSSQDLTSPISAPANANAPPPSIAHRKLQQSPYNGCLANPTAANCPDCYFTNDCCMNDNFGIYNGNLMTAESGCTANDLEFLAVTGFTVYDSNAYECNCGGGMGVPSPSPCPADPIDCQGKPHGTVFGACQGLDDNVEVSFTVDLNVGAARYDPGLYINTNGGHTKAGDECFISLLTTIDPSTGGAWLNTNNDVIVGDNTAKGDVDGCPDFLNSGDLTNYPFSRVKLSCTDSPVGSGVDGDGLLDFHIAASFSQNFGNDCSLDPTNAAGWTQPYPGTTSKCWEGQRITLNIEVPPYNTPSQTPSISLEPSQQPSTSSQPSSIPSERPSISIMPSEYPSQKPSTSSMPSSIPSEKPSTSSMPSSIPSQNPSTSGMPSSIPSQKPSTSSMPSSVPSQKPSTSSMPSSIPSQKPSTSSMPSSIPSEKPSTSSMPSFTPSEKPSTSSMPSSIPSQKPSVSQEPSVSSKPSRNTASPSIVPSISAQPSLSPSISAMPSSIPSLSPSTSTEPSGIPSTMPSISAMPSSIPSLSPSTSTEPTGIPSVMPSVSHAPSVSSAPSFGTGWPTDVPSTAPTGLPSSSPSTEPSSIPSSFPSGLPSFSPSSQPSISPTSRPSGSPTSVPTGEPSFSPSVSMDPSAMPSDVPSTSTNPSESPSSAPSSQPSAPPTGSLYYPDWENGEQICVNDGHDLEYMKRIQKDNYLYQSKEECCEMHFWWRITQCMDNEHPMYESNGEFCEIKVNLDQWEVKYTPQTWESSNLFETLEDCCNAKFWYRVPECIAASPKEISFDLSFDLYGLIEPEICQDADTIANALGVAMDAGLGGGVANVTSIGCVTLTRNPDTGNPECGGCLAGTSFSGDWDGTRPGGYYDIDLAQATNIQVEVSSQCDAADCADAAALTALYQQVADNFQTFFLAGEFEREIHSWSQVREPPVPELWSATVDATSYYTDGSFTNPLADPEDTVEVVQVTTTGTLSVPDLNQGMSAVSITTTGSFVVNNFDSSSFSPDQTEEVTGYFEEAIYSSLGSSLPSGSTVTVNSIENGVVQYSITAYTESSSAAWASVSQIESTFYQASTMSKITASLDDSIQASPNTELANDVGGMTVASFLVGSTTSPVTTSKATAEGTLAVSGLNPSELTVAQKEEVKDFFEYALAQELEDQGLLPESSSVVVTGLNDDGSVQYELNFYGTSSTNTAAAISNIEASLSQTSALSTITTTIQVKAASSTVASILSSASITGNTQDSTTGLIMTAAEEEDAKTYFATAITKSLDLPEDTTVTVTGIENGEVSYEITMRVDSSEDANTAVTTITTSLASPTTLQEVASEVVMASSTRSITLPGSLSVPNLNEEVEVVGVTTSGSFTVNSFDASSFSPEQTQEAMGHFEDALMKKLELLSLPDGSTATVTSISGSPPNTIVEYEVFTYASTAEDATTAVNNIESTVASSTSDITTLVVAESQNSSDPVIRTAMQLVDIRSHAAGATSATTSTSQVTASGILAVSNFDPTGFNADQIAEAEDYFESALTTTLTSQGLLPEGASATVTGIRNGVVSYDIHFFDDNTTASSEAIATIEASLASVSTLNIISSTVTAGSVSSSTSIASSLSSISIASNTQGGTTGITMTAADEEQAKSYFEAAITSSLGSDLPPGATVTVTNVESGAVEYLITMDVEASADGSTAVAAINSSLSKVSTLNTITTSVANFSSSSSSLKNSISGMSVMSNAPGTPTETTSAVSFLSGVIIASNTVGTTSESTVAEVTSKGQLTTNLSGLSPAGVTEASSYFESAIEALLRTEGGLSSGAFVTVSGIDANGVVSYTITMHQPPGAVNAVIINAINSNLASTSAQTAISNAVTSAASSAGSTIASLSLLGVTGFTSGETTGVSFKKWYPNWVTFGNYCNNDGNQPPFMKDSGNESGYLFATQKDCCAEWFPHADNCENGDTSGDKYYPKYADDECDRKPNAEFEVFEQDRYETLEECCNENFQYNRKSCCDSPGMGGCVVTGKIVFLPDWNNHNCVERSSSMLAESEEKYAHDSMSVCCNEYFAWTGC